MIPTPDQFNQTPPPPDSKAIVDGNLKLILGLIWTLILHYSISMPMWEDEDAKKLTPKQRLLGWIQNKVPQIPIHNFHRDWRDGKALGALVDNCAPGRSTSSSGTPWSSLVQGPGVWLQGLNSACRSVSRLGDLGPPSAGAERPRGHAAGRRLAGSPSGNRDPARGGRTLIVKEALT